MPKLLVAKKSDIPDGFEADYEERDGAWHWKTAPDTSKLEESLRAAREEKKAADKARKEADDQRADLERKLAAAGSGDDKVTKALAKFDADAAALKADYEKKLADANGQLRTLKLDDQVKAAFLKAGGRPDRADKALADTKARLDLADGDRILVKDAKGQATTETVQDFFGKSYRTEMPEFFTGTKAAGGGATGGARGTANTGTAMSPDDVIKNPMRALQQANETADSAA